MEWLTIVYLSYSFIAFYFLFLFILIYSQNWREIFTYPKPKENYSLSIVVPCYNGEADIKETIENLFKSNYEGLKRVVVVDDCSTDNSYNIMKQLAKKYSKLMVVQTPKNTGNAAGAKNYGAKFVDTELIGFTDDDSSPKEDAMSKMVGFFNDKKVGAVTSRVLVKNRENLLCRLQSIEYKIIAFTRKLLGFVEAIYVTNGPLSIYRKGAFDKVGGFDVKNLTEDIEITWHFVAEGYRIHMSVSANAYTIVPDTIKGWFKQRLRWNVGGIQTINKYKGTFLKCGMLGRFILPFFVFSWVIGIMGLFILSYRFFRMAFVKFLSAKYSVAAQTAVMTLRDINLTPNVLIFFGIMTFFMSLSFTILALIYSREREFRKQGLLSILIYMLFYLMIYPILLITSIYKYIRGYNKW